MKNLRNSLVARTVAFLMVELMVLVMFGCAFGIGIMYEKGAYSGADMEQVRDAYLKPWCVTNMYGLMESYRYGELPENLDHIEGMGFAIYDENDQLVYQSEGNGDYLLKTAPYGFNYPAEVIINRVTSDKSGLIITDSTGNTHFIEGEPDEEKQYGYLENEVPEEEETEEGEAPEGSQTQKSMAAVSTPEPIATSTPAPETTSTAEMAQPAETLEPVEDSTLSISSVVKRYKMVGYVHSDVYNNSQVSVTLRLYGFCYNHRTDFIWGLCGSGIMALLGFVFLMATAGHRKDREDIRTGFTEHIPFDLFTALIAVAGIICVRIAVEFSYTDAILIQMTGYGLVIAAGVSLCLWWCMSFAVRLKTHRVVKSCLCFRLLAWCWRKTGQLWDFTCEVFRGMRMMPKAMLVIGGILLVEFFGIIILGGDEVIAMGWGLERLALVMLTVYVLLCMKRLLQAGKEISEGNLDYHVDTGRMWGPLKEHGEQLNRITEGMTRAVNERMKSEHFRTELITNVSHDIKTPLTSIINYVDLLEKEEVENEKAREYLEVLSRQSARLKKLINDLMEASKASTGNMAVNWERCTLNVLIEQCTGEYAERLRNAQLELVVTKPEEPVLILADGRHMWRVFDNLLSNICKYAMAGTRVYLNLEKDGEKAMVTFRNISASQLNISGDELMERFVRGDASRNTEGSGLGLSIARSLTQLQKGQMELTVDGDLFKVTLKFNITD